METRDEQIATAAKLGILEEEYEAIEKLLGRSPNFTELSMFSVMWSEHCSYKNSILQLKTLPKKGPHILAEAGEENAGLVDIGDGYACAFKIESHNHPSAIEPYQGAATGVGGIHRDIFTMGARPIAALNSLRFGNLADDRTQFLLKGVVKGIGDYGNCFGVPTVGGEIYFDPCYQTNPLVNAMSVGILEKGKEASATAHGIGNPVYIVGSATGKDGIHGATFASEDITDDSTEKLPAVQIGDPFQEKLLLEASLEVIEQDLIIGMQDMGAAGITCSTAEMSFKGGAGMHIDLDKVPTRQANMQAFEILLSESQERMLIVGKKGNEAAIQAIFDKWEINCVQIGEIKPPDYGLQYYMKGEKVAHLHARHLALGGDTPVYKRETRKPQYMEKVAAFDINTILEPQDLKEVAKALTGNLNLASKEWVTEQYDHLVQINNIGSVKKSDAAISRVLGTNKGIAMTTDCNPAYIYANPEEGTAIAVAEAARNIVCSGGEPAAITNCLNFGNPYDPEVYWQFTNVIKGMKKACERFNTPVTGGNVSFYNQSERHGAVKPTPVIGMIGIVKNLQQTFTLSFQNSGDFIYLIGENQNDISSSQYLIHHHGVTLSPTPHFDMDAEFKLQQNLAKILQTGLVESVHDISEGGLFQCLLESGLSKNFGFAIQTDSSIRKDAFLFGESQSRALVSISAEQKTTFESKLTQLNQKFSCIGETTDGKIKVDNEDWGDLATFAQIHQNAFSNLLDNQEVAVK